MEVAEEAPLGSYRISAEVGAGSTSGSFEVAEYKKPEYKVKVSAPGRFVQTGQKTNFSIDARYFFGSPVANAEVKYYIYRSRYYAWGYGEDDCEETGEESESEDEYSQFYGGGDDMVQESEGKLDARGHLNVEFQIPAAEENETSDYSYRLEAQVTDSARRTMDGSGSFVATRGSCRRRRQSRSLRLQQRRRRKDPRNHQRLRRPAGFGHRAASVCRAHLDQKRKEGGGRRVFLSGI